jgi:ubiquinone/menaquinone biosynthesis C-methylase UbiE
VGGGPGVYACWLACAGYEVHLIDPVPVHLEQARAASNAQPGHPIAGLSLGDARQLARPDESADAVLLLGPLYHLTERADRIQAWLEARRVLRPGGRVIAAAISRFASALDGLARGLLRDPQFVPIVEEDLRVGRHRNATANPEYFTTAYFHRPEELRREAEDADLAAEVTLSVEGPLWLVPNLEALQGSAEGRALTLRFMREIEQEPSLLGASAHILQIARRPP